MSRDHKKGPGASQNGWFTIFSEKARGRLRRKKLFNWCGIEKAWETQKLQRAEVLT
jgi:hypothetical protein